MTLSRVPKNCRQCGEPFTPQELGKRLHDRCIDAFAKSREDRSKKRDERNARMARVVVAKQDKARKEKLKTIPDYIKEAQVAFNAWVRRRDEGKPCICCGRPLGEGDVGGAYDCGHYRSTGSASHLRFHPDNAHAQRKACNRWGAGRAVDYRRGLLERIGVERVEALESDNAPRKWTREELIAIKELYRAKRKELERQSA